MTRLGEFFCCWRAEIAGSSTTCLYQAVIAYIGQSLFVWDQEVTRGAGGGAVETLEVWVSDRHSLFTPAVLNATTSDYLKAEQHA